MIKTDILQSSNPKTCLTSRRGILSENARSYPQEIGKERLSVMDDGTLYEIASNSGLGYLSPRSTWCLNILTLPATDALTACYLLGSIVRLEKQLRTTHDMPIFLHFLSKVSRCHALHKPSKAKQFIDTLLRVKNLNLTTPHKSFRAIAKSTLQLEMYREGQKRRKRNQRRSRNRSTQAATQCRITCPPFHGRGSRFNNPGAFSSETKTLSPQPTKKVERAYGAHAKKNEPRIQNKPRLKIVLPSGPIRSPMFQSWIINDRHDGASRAMSPRGYRQEVNSRLKKTRSWKPSAGFSHAVELTKAKLEAWLRHEEKIALQAASAGRFYLPKPKRNDSKVQGWTNFMATPESRRRFRLSLRQINLLLEDGEPNLTTSHRGLYPAPEKAPHT
ncbi:hypothetical protein FNV43_RR03612 [Rhamnella rubrinervis]|uniref:Uncharacterized protein n=1 Tax=Rhamnella rubrinervis TaxID=2594499 RepID=A0A8K0HIR9_9ROSA|nr:hypothetical protein FNV43_RR03612 [Rhamnella rubrinervis]